MPPTQPHGAQGGATSPDSATWTPHPLWPPAQRAMDDPRRTGTLVPAPQINGTQFGNRRGGPFQACWAGPSTIPGGEPWQGEFYGIPSPCGRVLNSSRPAELASHICFE